MTRLRLPIGIQTFREVRERDCYSGAHIRFSLITGVSKFSKVSRCSGLNNLTDITLDPRYSAVCGYTETDLDTVFARELPGLDRDAIRDMQSFSRSKQIRDTQNTAPPPVNQSLSPG